MNRRLSPVALTLAMCLSASAWGQWSPDPQHNSAVADVAGATQVQPQIAPRADGHWWISWFSLNPQGSPPQGYDVYLQLLGPDGKEQFAHQGLQVAKLGLGWTEDYGLATDAQGNAFLAFQDDRLSAAPRAINATKVDSAGNLVWNSRTAYFGHSPRVAVLSDGQSMVGWTVDNNALRLRKLDALGQPVWRTPRGQPLDFILVQPNSSHLLADLQATADGSVIFSFVHGSDFSDARHLCANKLSPNGQLLWGPGHARIFDGGSLQQGNFPRFVADGNGGAVFAWYSAAPQLQVFAQHVLASGQLAFPPNGVPVSTDLQQARVNPTVSYQPGTGETTLLWTELGSAAAQSQRGLYAQKLDARGVRQWGETGRALQPLAARGITDLRSAAVAAGTLAFWVQTNGGQESIQGVKLDATGAPLCAQFAVSTRAAAKSRLTSGIAPSGQALLAWQEPGAVQGSNIYTQSVGADCKLGG